MELHVTFEFDDEIKGFTILNPPTIPCEGEIVNFTWEHFVTDEKELRKLDEFSMDHAFYANVLSRTYSKDVVEVLILLCGKDEYIQWKDTLARDWKKRRRRGGYLS